MAKVIRHINKTTNEIEETDSLVKRFKKAVMQENILLELRKHDYFLPKSLRRKEKSKLHRKSLRK